MSDERALDLCHDAREENLRPLTSLERAYIDRLLTAEFPGREQIRQQAEAVLARRIDPEGSLQLAPRAEVPADVLARVPVEGEAVDVDGMPIYFLLHVVDGQLSELEIYKADSSSILRMPPPDAIQVSSPPFS